ncbi:MAG: hypothetical protein QJR02_06165 [Sinobacteraceae bacterium]|nr:hypothetical protein [Nevskiaceae bacterium]
MAESSAPFAEHCRLRGGTVCNAAGAAPRRTSQAHVQETHYLLLHGLCDALDELRFPAA